VPSVHAEVVTKTPLITETSKCRLEQAVRMRGSLSSVVNFVIYLYCERNASKIKNSYFISFDSQICEEDAETCAETPNTFLKVPPSRGLKGLHQGRSIQTSPNQNSSETAFKTI